MINEGQTSQHSDYQLQTFGAAAMASGEPSNPSPPPSAAQLPLARLTVPALALCRQARHGYGRPAEAAERLAGERLDMHAAHASNPVFSVGALEAWGGRHGAPDR